MVMLILKSLWIYQGRCSQKATATPWPCSITCRNPAPKVENREQGSGESATVRRNRDLFHFGRYFPAAHSASPP